MTSKPDGRVESNEVGIQLDNKISTGHILTVIAMSVGGIGAYYDIKKDNESLRIEVSAMKAESHAKEARLRSVEIAQATQSSELRSINSGVQRIEATLEKLIHSGVKK